MDLSNSNGNSSFPQIAIIGGTFDTLHPGHKEYIKLAFGFAQKVYILLRTDEYAKISKSYKVKPYQERLNNVENFIKEIGCEGRYSIHPLESEASLIDFCLNHEISLAVIVPEYYGLFERINRLRELEKKKPFLLLIKQRTRTPEGFDINSTRLNGNRQSQESTAGKPTL